MKREQKEIDIVYLNMAKNISTFSRAIRRKVGCVIVKDRQIISDGYNGTPVGFSNVCETYDGQIKYDKYQKDYIYDMTDFTYEEYDYKCANEIANEKGVDALKTKPEVLHAEANAITKLSKSTQSSNGATIYITDEPCFDCSKLIIQAGIKRVVYIRPYTKHEGVELLKVAGISVEQIDI